uniref:non-specific serine/threonine protein kinase n=1 Tax=Aegilops tauschii subsp. strangulata TaxID=200361 RepID=A0A453BC40_AEGTS
MPQAHMKLSCFLLLLLVAVSLAICSVGQQFVYSSFAGANITLGGAAAVTTTGLLELTNGTLRQKAHAIHPAPFRFREPAARNRTVRSFSASFVFGILCPDTNNCGHGIVLFVAPGGFNFSAAFPSQYLGLVNNSTNGAAANHIFGVELDTDQNNEFRDIDGNHVGIDVNGLTSLASSSAGYFGDDGILHNLTLASGTAMQVWVDYDGEEKLITVAMAALGTAKPVKPLLSKTCDLSTVLTDTAYVGFSSATGSFNSQHYVLGWSFAMDGPAPAIDISKLPKLPRFGLKRHPKLAQIIPPVATTAFIFAAGTLIVLLIRRRLKYSELREDWEVEFGPHRFSYKDLFRATGGFKEKNLLGVGGFGRVYKGVLPAPKLEIAVKKVSHDSKQGMKEFIAEVVSIGRLQHRNLAQLHGYCRRKGELLLVYEYMSNGSLDRHLYGDGEKPVLDWDKSSKATPLTDVFAFGIFLLEVTCGQRPIRQNSQGEQLMLVDWVLEHWHRGSLAETVDTKLHSYDAGEACLALKLGLLCSHPLSNSRPGMRQVVRYLNEDVQLPELTLTNESFQILALMQNEGFDSYIMSYPSSMESVTTLSSLVEET